MLPRKFTLCNANKQLIAFNGSLSQYNTDSFGIFHIFGATCTDLEIYTTSRKAVPTTEKQTITSYQVTANSAPKARYMELKVFLQSYGFIKCIRIMGIHKTTT